MNAYSEDLRRRIVAAVGQGQSPPVAADPDATLAEYCARWAVGSGIAVSESTMCRAQQRLGWTVKKSH